MSALFASVLAHGAVGDGVHDDTSGIQTAINLGNILVQPGTYLVSSQITVPSNRIIRLLPGAIFKRKNGTGANSGNTFTNCNFWCNSDPVNGNTDITIEGGTYDGNESNQSDVTCDSTGGIAGGVGLRFNNVTRLTIKNVTVQNNVTFGIQVGNVTHFRIENVRLLFSGSRVHQDGIHVNGPAFSGVIRDIFSNGGNDALIALNADDAICGKMTSGGDIQDVLIDNVHCPYQTFTPYQGSLIMLLHGGFNIKDITARNFRGIGAQASAVIDLQTFSGIGSGGIIDRVVFENFDVETPCVNDAFCVSEQNIGRITFHNCRWRPGTISADPAATVQSFFVQNSGSVDHAMFDNIQIIEHNNSDNTPFAFSSVNRAVLNNILLTRPSGSSQGGFLVDASSGGVVNLLINGVQAELLSGLVAGNASGMQVTSGILTNPPI